MLYLDLVCLLIIKNTKTKIKTMSRDLSSYAALRRLWWTLANVGFSTWLKEIKFSLLPLTK